MATTTGQVILSNESQLISRNNRRYRRNPSESDGENTVIDQSEFTSRQGTENIDNYEPAYTESMGADEDSRTEQDYEPSTASTVSEDESDLIFEWQHERTTSTCTMIPESSGLARPKAGWDSSSFASFGTLVAAANNTLLLPQAPIISPLELMATQLAFCQFVKLELDLLPEYVPPAFLYWFTSC